ncbi:MAG TPA: hypothetical protein VIF62_09315, partial [Labilithrix sp.]
MVARAGLIVFALVIAACKPAAKTDARLSFEVDEKPLRTIAASDLGASETFTALDPYYNKKKTYRAVPMRPLLERGFAGVPGKLEEHDYVLRARDGYTVPLAGARLLEPGAYIAIADV